MSGNTDGPADIQQQMARIRRELHDDVEEVVEQAKELADWRNFVKSHPWLMVGAAAAVGFMVVPRRLNVISPDAATLAKLAKQNKLVVKAKPDMQKQGGIAAPLISFASAAILRSVVAMAGQQASKVWAAQSDTRSLHEPIVKQEL